MKITCHADELLNTAPTSALRSIALRRSTHVRALLIFENAPEKARRDAKYGPFFGSCFEICSFSELSVSCSRLYPIFGRSKIKKHSNLTLVEV